jgi:hypothetical protein
MPTFLSFRRAVKAHPQSLGVCALPTPAVVLAILLASCASSGVEPVTVGPPTGPLRNAPAAEALLATSAGLDAGNALAPANGNAPSPVVVPSPSTALTLEIEAPYPLDARPRAANAVQAAADDEELARWNLGGTADPNYLSNQASFHPGTRVVVDVDFAGRHTRSSRGKSRGLDADRVEAQARSKGYWPFRLCFEAGQREKKGLGGETRIVFGISLRGHVVNARVISAQLGNLSSTACLLEELRKLRFSPQRVRRLDVVASIRIWPGDAELPPLNDAPPAAVDMSKGFDPIAVRSRLTEKQTELSACFNEARRSDPSLWGRLAFAVILEVDGTVHRVSEVESHFPNASAAHCAAAALSTVVFPSVSGKPFSFVAALRLPPLGTRFAVQGSEPSPSSAPPNVEEPAPTPDNDGGADD